MLLLILERFSIYSKITLRISRFPPSLTPCSDRNKTAIPAKVKKEKQGFSGGAAQFWDSGLQHKYIIWICFKDFESPDCILYKWFSIFPWSWITHPHMEWLLHVGNVEPPCSWEIDRSINLLYLCQSYPPKLFIL